MRDRRIVRAAALAAAGAFPFVVVVPGARARVVEIAADRDNTLYQSATGDVSNGAGDAIFVGRPGPFGPLRRGLVHFNVQHVLPANATLNVASLLMNSTDAQAASTVFLHRVLADWGESTSNAGFPGDSGAPSTAGDTTWLHRSYPGTAWTTLGGDFEPFVSATSFTQIGTLQFETPLVTADVNGWLANPAQNFGWILLGDEASAEDVNTVKRIASREASFGGPALQLDYLAPVWNRLSGSGNINWSSADNWLVGGVPPAAAPNGAGHEAQFVTTGHFGPPVVIPVAVDGVKTVGCLYLDSPDKFVLAPPAGPPAPSQIRLDDAFRDASIVLTSAGGRQAIETPLVLAKATRIEVGSGSRLALRNVSAAAPGAKVTLLNLDGALDLTTNALVLTADAVPSGVSFGPYTGAQAYVRAGFNGGGWDGEGGLVTSEPAALNSLTTLGVATGEQTGYAGGTLRGVSVAPDDVIVMYTYAGDLNLDGTINPDDYALISFNDPNPSASGYYNGDINYDGEINADDFAVIDFNFNAQGGPFPTGSTASVSVVPEPECALIFGFALVAARRRRRPASPSSGRKFRRGWRDKLASK